MAIEKIRWRGYPPYRQSVYDSEELTALELAGRTTFKVNEVVDKLNNHVSEIKGELPDIVKTRFDELVEDGTMEQFINDEFFIGINTKVDTMEINAKHPPNPLEPAKGDGVTDDTEAIDAMFAYGSGRTPVFFPPGDYLYNGELYAGGVTRFGGMANQIKAISRELPGALRSEFTEGTKQNPTGDVRPIVYAEKYINADRADYGTPAWDAGSGYFQLEKWGGDAYATALTGYAKHRDGTGQIIGVHGRAHGNHLDAEVWGMWSYASAWPSSPEEHIGSAFGIESNIQNHGADMGWMKGGGEGQTIGVNSVTSDSSQPGTQAFRAGRNTGAGWHTGMLVNTDAIVPIDAEGNNEAYRANGGSTRDKRYGGLRFYDGYFDYGIKFDETTIETYAIKLGVGAGQSIMFGNRIKMYDTGTHLNIRTEEQTGIMRIYSNGHIVLSKSNDDHPAHFQVGGGGQFRGPVSLREYTTDGLPNAALWDYGLVIVTDDVDGTALAYSDGTNWKRVSDNGVIV